jgi:hypothetical protein
MDFINKLAQKWFGYIPNKNSAIKVYCAPVFINNEAGIATVGVEDPDFTEARVMSRVICSKNQTLTKELLEYNVTYMALEQLVSLYPAMTRFVIIYVPSRKCLKKILGKKKENHYHAQLDSIRSAASSFWDNDIPLFFKAPRWWKTTQADAMTWESAYKSLKTMMT